MTTPPKDQAEFELLCGDDFVASACGDRETAWQEICLHAAQYAQDGPVEIYEVTRRPIPAAPVDPADTSAQADIPGWKPSALPFTDEQLKAAMTNATAARAYAVGADPSTTTSPASMPWCREFARAVLNAVTPPAGLATHDDAWWKALEDQIVARSKARIGWCDYCGCGNDALGFAHLASCKRRVAQPNDPSAQPTRSQKLTAAGYTRRQTWRSLPPEDEPAAIPIAPPNGEQTALSRFIENTSECALTDPLERLRFFCSLAMNRQDWLDVKSFFDEMKATLPYGSRRLKPGDLAKRAAAATPCPTPYAGESESIGKDGVTDKLSDTVTDMTALVRDGVKGTSQEKGHG